MEAKSDISIITPSREKMQLQSLESEVERDAGYYNNITYMTTTFFLFIRHIELDSSHLEKREHILEEETSRRAVTYISRKEELVKELDGVEVCTHPHTHEHTHTHTHILNHRIFSIQSEISSLEAKLIILKNRKTEILSCISGEEDKIKSVEGDMCEEREQLLAERALLHQRQENLSQQQVRTEACVCACVYGYVSVCV